MRIAVSLFILVLSFQALCQTEDNISIEADAKYYYYLMDKTISQHFNYGFSAIIFRNTNKIGVGIGIDYRTKSFEDNGDSFFEVDKYEYKIEYLDFPFVLNYEIFSKNNFGFYFTGGFELNKIINYNITTYYLDGDVSDKKGDNGEKIGFSVFSGVILSKSISNRVNLKLSPVISYNLVPDHVSQRPNYDALPDDRLRFILSIGGEYIFKKK
ncbi:MAG: outer membrane beta-barrel protein [Bacteroidota bacterium]